MKPLVDVSLYLVTDRPLANGRRLAEVVRSAVAGGVTCVQLREKDATTREFIALARELVATLQPLGVPLIINDRVDVALAVGAAGVHLGQGDMTLADARRLMPQGVIGVSVESAADARAAEAGGADLVAASPVFATPTKTDTAPALGLAGLAEIRAATRLPLVTIGGMNEKTVEAVIRAGADGVAVVSAIMAADSPEAAAARLCDCIQKGKNRK